MDSGDWPIAAFVFHLDTGTIFLNLMNVGDPLVHIDNVEKILNRAAQDDPNSRTRCVLFINSYQDSNAGLDGYISFRFDWMKRDVPLKQPRGVMPPGNQNYSVLQSSESFIPAGFHPIFAQPVSIEYAIQESEADTLLSRFTSLDEQ
jgi:hypothetical protein